ncbi:antileukoproteinase-like [Cariama cristata]
MDPQKGAQHGHHKAFSWRSIPAQEKAAPLPPACLRDDALDHLPLACPSAPALHTRTSQGHSSMKTVAALLLVGMLILWTELPTGSAWSCPPVHITCAMLNPPNKCYSDRQCPRYKKCCQSFCGRKCLSRPSSLPVFYV